MLTRLNGMAIKYDESLMLMSSKVVVEMLVVLVVEIQIHPTRTHEFI